MWNCWNNLKLVIRRSVNKLLQSRAIQSRLLAGLTWQNMFRVLPCFLSTWYEMTNRCGVSQYTLCRTGQCVSYCSVGIQNATKSSPLSWWCLNKSVSSIITRDSVNRQYAQPFEHMLAQIRNCVWLSRFDRDYFQMSMSNSSYWAFRRSVDNILVLPRYKKMNNTVNPNYVVGLYWECNRPSCSTQLKRYNS